MDKEKFSPDIIRKITRIAIKASRGSSHQRKTEERLNRFVKDKSALGELLEQEPIFSNRKEKAPKRMHLSEEVRDAFPEEFFSDPTTWIESQPRLEQDVFLEPTTKSSIHQVMRAGSGQFDYQRIKKIVLEYKGRKITLVSKRLNPKQEDMEEVAIARRAYEAGIPTPKVLGEIEDRGNFYVLYEYIPSRNLDQFTRYAIKKMGIYPDFSNPRYLRVDATEKEKIGCVTIAKNLDEAMITAYRVLDPSEYAECEEHQNTILEVDKKLKPFSFINERLLKLHETFFNEEGNKYLRDFLFSFSKMNSVDGYYVDSLRRHGSEDPLSAVILAISYLFSKKTLKMDDPKYVALNKFFTETIDRIEKEALSWAEQQPWKKYLFSLVPQMVGTDILLMIIRHRYRFIIPQGIHLRSGGEDPKPCLPAFQRFFEKTSVIEKFEESLHAERDLAGGKIALLILKKVLGMDPFAERARIQRKIAEEDLEQYYDIAMRNTIIAWDEEHDMPARDENGKAKMYVLDWEGDPEENRKRKRAERQKKDK